MRTMLVILLFVVPVSLMADFSTMNHDPVEQVVDFNNYDLDLSDGAVNEWRGRWGWGRGLGRWGGFRSWWPFWNPYPSPFFGWNF